jgi:hypothetical protein
MKASSPSTDLGRLHPGLEVVEEDVVRLVVALEAVDVAALQLHRALQVGEEEGVVVLLARLRPDVVRLGGRAGHLGRELRRHAAGLLPVAARGADQRGLVGVVVEALLVLAQALEQHADLVRDELPVRDPVERRKLLAADGAAARRHHHRLVPEEQLQRAAEIVDLGQPCLQLLEALAHGTPRSRVRRDSSAAADPGGRPGAFRAARARR